MPGKPHGITLKPSLMWNGDCKPGVCLWTRTFAETVSSMRFHACFLRYVDNRLLFAPQSILKLPWVQLLLSMESNGQAMILEDEQKYDFLVFQIDFAQGLIKYNRAIQDSDLLDPLSAAPKTTLLSGLLSRAFLIKKCGYPNSQMCNFYGSLLICEASQSTKPNSKDGFSE